MVLLATASPFPAYATPCSETAPDYTHCLEKLVLSHDDSLTYQKQRVDLLEQRLLLKDEQLNILKEDRKQLADALGGTRDALSSAGPKWYDSPILWLGVGLFLGSAVTIGVGVAASQAWRR